MSNPIKTFRVTRVSHLEILPFRKLCFIIYFVLLHLPPMSKRSKTNVKGNRIRGFKRKLLLIDKRGGECMECGYSKNLAALQFHHREADKKSFSLSQRGLAGKSMNELITEFNKCDLLCANCHSEHHNPYAETENIRKEIAQHEKNRVKNTTGDI